jgi:hypothetical protein
MHAQQEQVARTELLLAGRACEGSKERVEQLVVMSGVDMMK